MSIESRVNRILVDQLFIPPSEIKPTATIVDDLGADSLDIVEIVMALEEEFDIEVPDDDCTNFQPCTVQGIYDYVRKATGVNDK